MSLITKVVFTLAVAVVACARDDEKRLAVETSQVSQEEKVLDLELNDLKSRLKEEIDKEKGDALDFTGDGKTNDQDLLKLEAYPNLPDKEVQRIYRKTMRHLLKLSNDPKSIPGWDVNKDSRFDVSDLILIRRALSRKMNDVLMVKESISTDFEKVESKIHTYIRMHLFGDLTPTVKNIDFNHDGQINVDDVIVWRSYVQGDLTSDELTEVGASILELFKVAREEAEVRLEHNKHFDFNDSGEVDISDIRPLRNFMRKVRVRYQRRNQIKLTEAAITKYLASSTVFLPEFDFNQDGKSNLDDVTYLADFRSYQDPNYSVVYKQIMNLGLDAIEKNRRDPVILDIFDADHDEEVESEEVDRLLLLIAREST